jgi:hypothetical protein
MGVISAGGPYAVVSSLAGSAAAQAPDWTWMGI